MLMTFFTDSDECGVFFCQSFFSQKTIHALQECRTVASGEPLIGGHQNYAGFFDWTDLGEQMIGGGDRSGDAAQDLERRGCVGADADRTLLRFAHLHGRNCLHGLRDLPCFVDTFYFIFDGLERHILTQGMSGI